MNTAPCGCWIGAWFGVNPPPMCATHSLGSHTWPPRASRPEVSPLPVAARRLHPDDIEAIAKRFAALVAASTLKAPDVELTGKAEP